MDLTPGNKEYIDSLSYIELLDHWRFAPVGYPWFQGETSKYWGQRMAELRSNPNGDIIHTQASKEIGW